MKSNTCILLLTGLSLSISGISPIKGQNYVSNLPLQLQSAEHFFSNTTNGGSAKIDWKALNQFTALKNSSWTQTGTATMVIAINDIPGFLNVKAVMSPGQTCTSGNHNDLTISESADNNSYQSLNAFSANNSYDQNITLAPTTRFIKFHFNVKANGLFNGSYCGHEFDPVEISLPKSIDISEGTYSLLGKTGEILRDTILVNYSNPQGNLILESSDQSFIIRKLNTENEAGQEGISQFEVSFTSDTETETRTVLKAYDAGFTEAFEEITLSANIISDTAPEAPSIVNVIDINYSNANIQWGEIENAASYIVVLHDQNHEYIKEYAVGGNSFIISELTPGNTYHIGIKSVNLGGKESTLSQLVPLTTKAIEIPENLAYIATKNSISISWSATLSAEKYLLQLIQNENTVLESIEMPNTATSHEFKSLTKGCTYTVSIQSIIGFFKSEAASVTATTYKDYGQQLMNSDFENWEKVSKGSEPTNWNSFANAAGKLANTAKAEQVKQATDVRTGSTGNSSAHIFSRDVLGIAKANGNLTTGQINAGNMTPTNMANFNAIVPGDPNFHQIITREPDSVSIWVKYVPENSANADAIARMSFILHGDGIVNEPSEKESELVTSHAVYEWGPNAEWERVSFEFIKKNDIAPKYMLASVTTNKTPGVATGNQDNVYIDDLVLIYKPSLKAGILSSYNYQEGETFELPYTLEGSMSVSNIDAPANTVYAELSDENGSFENAIVISEPVTTDESGTIQAQLPAKMATGSNYRVRVVTTNYPMNDEVADVLHIEGSDIGTSIDEAKTKACKLYPNPAKDRIFVTDAKESVYRIYNISNQSVIGGKYNSQEGIDVSALPTGVYFIEINTKQSTQILKFIKE